MLHSIACIPRSIGSGDVLRSRPTGWGICDKKCVWGCYPRVGVGLSSKNVSDRRVADSLDLAFPDTD